MKKYNASAKYNLVCEMPFLIQTYRSVNRSPTFFQSRNVSMQTIISKVCVSSKRMHKEGNNVSKTKRVFFDTYAAYFSKAVYFSLVFLWKWRKHTHYYLFKYLKKGK